MVGEIAFQMQLGAIIKPFWYDYGPFSMSRQSFEALRTSKTERFRRKTGWFRAKKNSNPTSQTTFGASQTSPKITRKSSLTGRLPGNQAHWLLRMLISLCAVTCSVKVALLDSVDPAAPDFATHALFRRRFGWPAATFDARCCCAGARCLL